MQSAKSREMIAFVGKAVNKTDNTGNVVCRPARDHDGSILFTLQIAGSHKCE
jgi:hypothetical protein